MLGVLTRQMLSAAIGAACTVDTAGHPAQEEAILELFEGKNVILNTPTGSGKTLVASAVHFASLARGRRSVYTSPIKALASVRRLLVPAVQVNIARQ